MEGWSRARNSKKHALAKTLIIYVVSGFVFCSLLPAVVFHRIEGSTVLDAWYFTMTTLLTIGVGDLVLPTCKLIMVRHYF